MLMQIFGGFYVWVKLEYVVLETHTGGLKKYLQATLQSIRFTETWNATHKGEIACPLQENVSTCVLFKCLKLVSIYIFLLLVAQEKFKRKEMSIGLWSPII